MPSLQVHPSTQRPCPDAPFLVGLCPVTPETCASPGSASNSPRKTEDRPAASMFRQERPWACRRLFSRCESPLAPVRRSAQRPSDAPRRRVPAWSRCDHLVHNNRRSWCPHAGRFHEGTGGRCALPIFSHCRICALRIARFQTRPAPIIGVLRLFEARGWGYVLAVTSTLRRFP